MPLSDADARENALLAGRVATLEAELAEARRQQSATAEILQTIRASRATTQPVFEKIVRSGRQLIPECAFSIAIAEEGMVRIAAISEDDPQFVALWTEGTPHPLTRHYLHGRAILDGQIIELPDILQDLDGRPRGWAKFASTGYRAMTLVPLLHDGKAFGAIAVPRVRPGPLTENQLALLRTFADEAAIAIENARLFDELQSQKRELADSLESQIATSLVLGIVAKSPGKLQSVLDEIVRNGESLCEADYAFLFDVVDGRFRVAASSNVGDLFIEVSNAPIDPNTVIGRAAIEKRTIHIDDLLEWKEYSRRDIQNVGGQRTVLAVPLMRGDALLGVLTLMRKRVLRFSDRQIRLTETFADQAVIAMENARLFEAEQARAREAEIKSAELREALEYNAASAQVLEAIARSPSELMPVLQAIAEMAARMCDNHSVAIWLPEDGAYRLRVTWGLSDEYREIEEAARLKPDRGSIVGRVALTGRVEHIHDCLTDPDYTLKDDARVGGLRTILGVPLLRVGEVVGVITLWRYEVAPFTNKQIEIVASFANQAVIAINNAHLFEAEQARTRELEAKSAELAESLEYQTAISDVLAVISRSPNELQPVLDTIVETAVRLCQSTFGHVRLLREDGAYHIVAHKIDDPELVEQMRQNPFQPGTDSISGRAALEGRTVHVADVAADPQVGGFQRQIADKVQTAMGVPLKRNGKVIGLIAVFHGTVRPFTERQIKLVETFADQAVIAINNVGLFEQVQSRTRELTESLEYETALGEVLRVISSSPTDIGRVFETVAENAARLCESMNAAIFRRDSDALQLVATHGPMPGAKVGEWTLPLDSASVAGRAVLEARTLHVTDLQAETATYPVGSERARRYGYRTLLAVPMLRDGTAIGAITLRREEARGFTHRQISLLQAFADQAVIAIENARLFAAEQARTGELKESLEYQTAISDVFSIVARSSNDVSAVFEAVIANACRLCGSAIGNFVLYDGQQLTMAVTHGIDAEVAAQVRARYPAPPGREQLAGRVVLAGRTIEVVDVQSDPDYPTALAKAHGIKSACGVPLMRDGRVHGAIVIARRETGSFTRRQISLLETFADQAVIAIENARLLDELRVRQLELTQALDARAAVSDVLAVISRSKFELSDVFQALAAAAARLCRADRVIIHLKQGESYPVFATLGGTEELNSRLHQMEHRAGSASIMGQVLLRGEIVHVEDAQTDPTPTASIGSPARARVFLGVPFLRDGDIIGAIVLNRLELPAFSEQDVKLVETFADQALIAIENARLLDELQTRQRELEASTKELRESLEYQTATSDVLSVISRSPSDLQPVLDQIVATAQGLCECYDAVIALRDGDELDVRAVSGSATVNRPRLPLVRDLGIARAILDRKPVHVADLASDEAREFRLWQEIAEVHGIRTGLAVPLMRGGEAIGGIALRRKEMRPFTEKQIELVTTFADQAVIAIENARLLDELQRRQRELEIRSAELAQSLEYQVAISEVLGVISKSSRELQPVFDTIADMSQRLCKAERAVVSLLDRDGFRLVARAGRPTPAGIRARVNATMAPLTRASVMGRAALEKRSVHIADIREDPELTYMRDVADDDRRTMLGVPLIHHGQVVGIINLMQTVVSPFTPRQIALVETFADQAVIAIENARLLDELQVRQRELQESLEYQTAISDVLSVMSRSRTELQPVMDAIVSTAARLTKADRAAMRRNFEGEYRITSLFGYSEQEADYVRITLGSEQPPSVREAIATRSSIQVDVGAEPPGAIRQMNDKLGLQISLTVPLVRNNELIGILRFFRKDRMLFTKEQIALVETFADQAVIAIENARLLDELQTQQRELTESLEYQTAISEVLSVISRSPTDVQPVFETIAENAARLCGGVWSTVNQYDGETINLAAWHNLGNPSAVSEVQKVFPRRPGKWGVVDKAILTHDAASIDDFHEVPDYPYRAALKATGMRSMLAVPLLNSDRAVGAISVAGVVPHAFTARHARLLKAFADQAVIAINNVGLFEEVQERQRDLARSVGEMRSLAEVGRTVSSSLDMAEVLSTILQHACRMSDTSGGTIYVYDKASGTFRVEAAHNMLPEHLDRVRAHPMRIGDAVVGECVERREAVQVPDIAQLEPGRSPLIAILLRGGTRALLAVPLLHQGEVLGALVVRRGRPGEFPPDTVRLLEAFAAQSAIAINNALLFNEVREKGRELELASRHKSQFVANMSHELRTPLAAVLGYAELMREGIFGALPAEAMNTIERIQSNGKHLLGLINAVLDMSKIEAGQFDLQPVEYSVASLIETVKVATESLAREKGLRFVTEVTAGMPIGYGDEPRLAQVLLNLVGNAIKFTDKGEVRMRADAYEGRFLIDVVDTGPGIPASELGRIFEEFHQVDSSSTKAKGGTGLGLTIAKRIVELHGGTINVNSQVGAGSTFRLELPIRTAGL